MPLRCTQMLMSTWNITYSIIFICQVSRLLKQFMLQQVTPELQKDSKERSTFIKDPLKAALIMLYVWKQYHLELDNGTLSHLCTALCLPKLPKDEFLSFWTDIMESFSVIKKWVQLYVITSECMSVCRFPYCSRARDYPFACHCWISRIVVDWGLYGCESTHLSDPEKRKEHLREDLCNLQTNLTGLF